MPNAFSGGGAAVATYYWYFLGVHVMVFIGFGFLMT